MVAIRYFQSRLLYVDVLWKIYDVGGGAGEIISMPVAQNQMGQAEQTEYQVHDDSISFQ